MTYRYTVQATSKAGTTLIYRSNDPQLARVNLARLTQQGYAVTLTDHEED